jgi:hypothetical protein
MGWFLVSHCGVGLTMKRSHSCGGIVIEAGGLVPLRNSSHERNDAFASTTPRSTFHKTAIIHERKDVVVRGCNVATQTDSSDGCPAKTLIENLHSISHRLGDVDPQAGNEWDKLVFQRQEPHQRSRTRPVFPDESANTYKAHTSILGLP